jgi:hypothetical protein
MSKLGVACGAAFLSFGMFAACAGDDEVKHARDTDAGAGGLEAGTGGDVGAGGSSSPAAGEGGTAVAAAGEGGATMSGSAGDGGVALAGGGVGGSAEAGAGGASLDCPEQPGSFTYSCADIVGQWSPVYDKLGTRFVLDVSSLEFPIVSGSLSFQISFADGTQCGTVNVTRSGGNAVAAVAQEFTPTTERITDFDLVDACGSHHVFDEAGAPNCYEISGSDSFQTQALTCSGTVTNTCPAACE